MTAAAHAPTPTEYIVHHLGHLTNAPQTKVVDFSIINLDTIFWSVFCGVLACLVMYLVARKATSGVPGRLQALVEMVVEMVDGQSKSIVHGDRRFIAPMAMMIFVWILLMNCLDFLPVDLGAAVATQLGYPGAHHRIVPTADLNGTLGIALGILVLMFYFSLKVKGVGGFVKELFVAPFGPAMAPFNFVLNVIEYAAKTISLAMRLFGNMYAGELLFMLIALLGATATTTGFIGNVLAGSVWAIFHILIVLLQAFIFMMLTLVYMGQAHDGH